MYRNSYQRGMLTVFFSVGSKPLAIWDTHTQDGYITRFLDQDIKSMVLEIGGTNVSTTYITCPKGNLVLGITMPFLIMIVKNLRKYFSFEVTILDETGTRRRFRVSNFQSSTQILPLCTVMPIGLSEGWNQIQFNLAEFTRRAYKKQYVEVQKIKINANIRLRRIYFTERLVPDDQLPAEYKLFFPLASKVAKEKMSLHTNKVSNKENAEPSTSQKQIETMQTIKTSKNSMASTKSRSFDSIKLSKHSIKTIPEDELVKFSSKNSATSALLPLSSNVSVDIEKRSKESKLRIVEDVLLETLELALGKKGDEESQLESENVQFENEEIDVELEQKENESTVSEK